MPNDFRRGLGCALLFVGVLMGSAGLLTLTGIFPMLEFFEIEVDTRFARIVWTAGFAAAAIVGYLLFRHQSEGS